MQKVKNHTALEEHIVKTLLYYDIFNYPLTADEIFTFLGTNHVVKRDIVLALGELSFSGLVNRFGEFYSLQTTEASVIRRIKGNAEAERMRSLAQKQARLISRFPFVRGVLASGSLSKNYMDENSDLDFFIITAPKHLWICKTLLVLYKKIFLKNSHKYFCINYFVTSDRLEIEEKNLFTATELATVLPLYGADYYASLMNKNLSWLLEFFPNYKPRSIEGIPLHYSGWMKKMIENFLRLFPLEKMLMDLTLGRWKRVYEKKYSGADFKVAFKTTPQAAKNHPRHYQKKVMETYFEKLSSFKERLQQYEP